MLQKQLDQKLFLNLLLLLLFVLHMTQMKIKQEEVTWKEAVHIMEEIVNEKIKTFDTKDLDDLDEAMKVANAWHRILRG